MSQVRIRVWSRLGQKDYSRRLAVRIDKLKLEASALFGHMSYENRDSLAHVNRSMLDQSIFLYGRLE